MSRILSIRILDYRHFENLSPGFSMIFYTLNAPFLRYRSLICDDSNIFFLARTGIEPLTSSTQHTRATT
jgi:hypothetical protein